MPAHAFGAIVVKIEEAGVEGFTSGAFHVVFQFREKGIPRDRFLSYARVGVGEVWVTIPSDFTGSGDGFAEHFYDVVFPRNVLLQGVEELVSLILR